MLLVMGGCAGSSCGGIDDVGGGLTEIIETLMDFLNQASVRIH